MNYRRAIANYIFERNGEILLILFIATQLTFAQVLPLIPQGQTCDPNTKPCEIQDIYNVGQRFIKFIVTELAPVLAFIFVLWGGFLMMLAGPSPGKEKQGKDMIYTALVGYVLVLISGFIIDLVLGFLGGGKGIEGLKFGK